MARWEESITQLIDCTGALAMLISCTSSTISPSVKAPWTVRTKMIT